MKKIIFLWLAACLALILPISIMANDRAGPSDILIITLSNTTEYECFTPDCNIKDVTKSGTLIVADNAKDATIPRTANDPSITMRIRTDEAQMINIMTPFTRENGADITVILDKGAQKTKFPSSDMSAMAGQYNVAWTPPAGPLRI